ncbi:hypothetical protein [Consotaella salsifontis]|uniref:Uncharacterized protein n=1 Tax=Consotaella salsifontis TaxID=1365950 RepID=A0A1T4RRF1_9HYPH|nr:hypothetical protein [Consotaella salsifontis]SKA18523.1 hypothetical protein SAMN05428963_107200 [Consotaella salsifontis]
MSQPQRRSRDGAARFASRPAGQVLVIEAAAKVIARRPRASLAADSPIPGVVPLVTRLDPEPAADEAQPMPARRSRASVPGFIFQDIAPRPTLVATRESVAPAHRSPPARGLLPARAALVSGLAAALVVGLLAFGWQSLSGSGGTRTATAMRNLIASSMDTAAHTRRDILSVDGLVRTAV